MTDRRRDVVIRDSVWQTGRSAGKAPQGELLSVAGKHAGEPVDRPERGNAAGLAGYRRQCNQCQNGATSGKRPTGQATDALNRAKQQAGK